MASEKISVVLEADAKQLTGEFQRARESADALSKKSLPLVAANLNSAWVQNQKLADGLRKSQGATRGAGQGLLQIAQTADDAQYGLKGVLNNIPSLIMGLGGGAGIAGVASLAALGLFGVHKALKAITGVDNMEAFDKSMEAARKAGFELTDTLQQQTRERREQEALQQRLSRHYAAESDHLKEALDLEDKRNVEIELRTRETARRRTIEDQLRAARQTLGNEQDSGANGVAEAKLRLVRLEEDLAIAYEKSAIANEAYNRVIRNGGAALSERQTKIASLRAELQKLEDRNNFTQGDLRAAQDGLKNAPTGRGTSKLSADARANLAILKKRDAEERARLAEIRGSLDEEVKLLEQAREANAGNVKLVTEQSEARREAVAALREEIKSAKELREIEKQRAANAEEIRLQQEAAARRASMNEAKQRAQDELIMKGNGDTTTATNIDAQRRNAYRTVTALRDRAIREAGLIPTARGIGIGRPTGGLGGPRGLDGPRGLGRDTRRRFGREDAAPDLSNAQKAAAYYVKALENDEKLIKAFQAIGLL